MWSLLLPPWMECDREQLDPLEKMETVAGVGLAVMTVTPDPENDLIATRLMNESHTLPPSATE